MRLPALLCTLVFLAGAQAQLLGGLVAGVVKDANGKLFSGVAMLLVQNETDRHRNTVTGSMGEFTISNLPPGDYRIEAAVGDRQKQVQRFALPLNHEI